MVRGARCPERLIVRTIDDEVAVLLHVEAELPVRRDQSLPAIESLTRIQRRGTCGERRAWGDEPRTSQKSCSKQRDENQLPSADSLPRREILGHLDSFVSDRPMRSSVLDGRSAR